MYYKKNGLVQFVFFVIYLISMTGCNKSGHEVYYDKSFNEISGIANNADLPFCIVLIDSSQVLSKEYLIQLNKNQNHTTQKTIFCVNDINSTNGEWLLKWLRPISLPLTCIFTPQGDLFDLIPGTSIETFSYLDEAVKTTATTEFHWPNQFKMDKRRVLPLLNSLLSNKKYLDQGIYIPEDINNVIDSLPYPYSYYLKLTGALMEHDSTEAQSAAKYLLELENPYIMELYKNEFITAKTTLNKEYKAENDAIIRIEQDTINLPNCKINESIPITIDVYNDGGEPLIISKIHTSCSCLKQLNTTEQITVSLKQSVKLKFNFTPDLEGDVFRDIYIASNGINMPMLHVSIIATVIH